MLLVMTPVGLEQHGVDMLGIDGFGLVAHGLDHGPDAEVFDRPERALRTAGDEAQGGLCEGAVGQPDEVELAEDEVGDGIGSQALDGGGVGDAASDVLVDPEPTLWLLPVDFPGKTLVSELTCFAAPAT